MKWMRSVVALVHDAVDLLIVDLIGFADLQGNRAPVDHEPHARIGDDGHVDTVASRKGRMRVPVRQDEAARA